MYPGYWSTIQGEKPAAIQSETGDSISYSELDNRSMQLAQFLCQKGLRRGDHIALFMENNLRYFEIVWAALRSGFYFTPVNRFLTADEAAYIINDCEAKALISSAYLKETAANLIPHLANPELCRLMTETTIAGYDSYEKEIAKQPARPLDEEPLGAFMLYSSGSTGRPKGIIHRLPNRTVDNYPEAGVAVFKQLWGFSDSTVYLSTAPNYHSAPLLASISTQRLGGTVVMMPKFDAEKALHAIERYRVTHSQWVPTMFHRLLKLSDEQKQRYDLSSMRCVIHGAAPCPRHIKKQMIDWWGPIIFEYYGASEGTGQTNISAEEWLKKPGSVGKSILGTIHICDSEGKELPPGESGTVYFELPKTPFEYKNDKSKTQSCQHPRHPNWCAVGDIGYVDEDGYLFLNDRSSFMIISGGVNIYPQEVEDALIAHPKVADIAVFGVPNDEMGEEVKALVQLEDHQLKDEATIAELMAFAKEHLAHYKCPKSIDLVDSLPRLETGKLYKKPLKEKYWQGHESSIV